MIAPRLPSTLKTLALCCFIGGPVLHGFVGPGVGAAAVALGLAGYLAGLALAVLAERRLARGLAALSLALGGWFLGTWAWVRFGPALVDGIPLGVDPWVGRAAIAVEIAALAAALTDAPKHWVALLAALWCLALPPIQRALFLGVPQVATLTPSFMAVAAMMVLNQRARLARDPSRG